MLRLTLFVAIAISVCSCCAALKNEWKNNRIIEAVSSPEVMRKIESTVDHVRNEGCDANICFALQGGNGISRNEFELQKDFVGLMVAILGTGRPGNYCAVQYGNVTRPISSLTERREVFLDRLDRAVKIEGRGINIANSLAFAHNQLGSRQQNVNKFIIVGKRLQRVGSRARFLADHFRNDNSQICAVAIGRFDLSPLETITGDRNLIFTVHQFFDLAEVVVELVNNVCGFFIA